LRRFENRERRIFGTKKEKVWRGWRKLHKEELKYLCASPNIIRVSDDEMGGTYRTDGNGENAHKKLHRKI
jgi:hypothetical protein